MQSQQIDIAIGLVGIERAAGRQVHFIVNNFEFSNIDDKQGLINQLRVVRNNLSYWYKVQLSTI